MGVLIWLHANLATWHHWIHALPCGAPLPLAPLSYEFASVQKACVTSRIGSVPHFVVLLGCKSVRERSPEQTRSRVALDWVPLYSLTHPRVPGTAHIDTAS